MKIKKCLSRVNVSKVLYSIQCSSICEGREFIVRPARYKCLIENIKLKLIIKSQIYKCLPELLMMLENSQCYIVQPCFCKYLC